MFSTRDGEVRLFNVIDRLAIAELNSGPAYFQRIVPQGFLDILENAVKVLV